MIQKIKSKIKVINEYHNPFYHWWKVRKYFKRPKARFKFGKDLWIYGMLSKHYINSIIDIQLSSLGWKSKYDMFRHEFDPFICIILFKKYVFLWEFNWIDDPKWESKDYVRSMATWEAILDYLYHHDSLQEVYNNHQWSGDITILENLTEEGIKECLSV